jgi:hypothetical protein
MIDLPCSLCPRNREEIPGTGVFVCVVCDDASGGLLRLLEQRKGERS